MGITYLMKKSLLDRLVGEYEELSIQLEAFSDEAAQRMKTYVRRQLERIAEFYQYSNWEDSSRDLHQVVRELKLELRTAQRKWRKHLVTQARMEKIRRNQQNELTLAEIH
ncbi:MAG: hypothetical protein H6757_05755 [Candidatus Omnitrophica bacterium]|nr:hypothetical protein [Candidatus Omnitrophota bacterium]